MKFTFNWLKDFVNIKITAQQLADKLTMAGIEVESLEKKDSDFIFQIEITSNRPDWLSVMGIAREVAAITGAKPKLSGARHQPHKIRHQPPFYIKIEDKKDCPLYTAKIIRDVKVGPAPEWMRKRLELIGCRSINNIVDITNYILFTYGHPLHAFDLDKLGSDTIIVRRARDNEKIVTINDKTAGLDREILVIADKDKPVAVAGVIGGKDTEVTKNTKAVLLESAVFNPVVVRRSRQKLGLQTESSYRFERGTDPETAVSASLAAMGLIKESGGVCLLDKATALPERKKNKIILTAGSIEKVLGISISASRIKTILKHLGFNVKQGAGHGFIVEPPAYRQDVSQDVDLIEELARVSGYEHIPATLPQIKPQLIPSLRGQQVSLIKNILCSLGLNEVITYSLVDRGLENGYLPAQGSSEAVEILNPLSLEQEILRPLIGPSLVKCVAHNLNQKQEYVNIFEIANVFPGYKQGLPREECVLGIALCGEKPMLLEQGLIKEKTGLLHLKGILETVFYRLGISGCKFVPGGDEEIGVFLGQEKLASLRKINREFLNKLDVKNKDVFTAEVYLDAVLAHPGPKKKFKELPLYPAILRDISLVLKEGIRTEEVLSEIRQKAGLLLEEVKVVDYYKGKQISPGLRSLTISCLYRSGQRTLTEEEISPLHNSVLHALVDKFGAQIR